MTVPFATLIGSLILLVIIAGVISAQTPAGNGYVALTGGTIYVSSTEDPIRNGVVLINDGKIAAVGVRAQVNVPQSAQLIDCSGRTITAGFWNSHVHFMERKWIDAAGIPAPELNQQLEDMLTRYGFTAALDLSSPWEKHAALTGPYRIR